MEHKETDEAKIVAYSVKLGDAIASTCIPDVWCADRIEFLLAEVVAEIQELARGRAPSPDVAAARLRAARAKQGAWISCTAQLPNSGVPVETAIIDSHGERNHAVLKRGGELGTLWFVEDGSMYVYYTPTHWRPKS